MTTFTFTDPSGRTHDVEGPAGATQEQAFQVLQQRLGAAAPAPAALPPMDVDPSAGMNAGEKMLVGAGAATDRAIRGVKSLFGAKDEQGAEDAALYQKHHPGWLGHRGRDRGRRGHERHSRGQGRGRAHQGRPDRQNGPCSPSGGHRGGQRRLERRHRP